MAHVFVGNDPDQPTFNLFRRLARRKPKPVADAQYVGVDCHRVLTKSHVENDICGLAPNPRQLDQLVAVIRHHTFVIANERFGQGNDVLGLVAPKTDGEEYPRP
jgi:hypothetical protein